MTRLVSIFGMLWALPYTLLGLCVGLVGICCGGRVQRRGRVLEFYEGGTRWFVCHLPGGQFVLAFTLGNVVLGQTQASLDIAREHELVHVRQYARWGPLMGPVYLGCSLCLWLRGRDPYRENPFEREAYGDHL